jgi:Nif-specific regulatory protein
MSVAESLWTASVIDQSPTLAIDQIRRERDLYRRLLALGAQTELRPLLAEALGLMVEVLGARLGYLELLDDQSPAQGSRWSMAHGLTAAEIEDVRAAVSQGIVAEALATGKTIATPSAFLDSRFEARDSVRIGRIEAVLCTPIGQDPPVGVLYLQGRRGARPFSDEDRDMAELFARQLAPLAHRLLVREQAGADSTRPARTALRLENVIGRSEALGVLLRQVALIAPLDVSVLLTGQSGTGKTQIARVIHENSPRAGQPFVEVNCAALPEALFESELFGAMPGAHSTATRRMLGKVAGADHGTLLLDEVGDLSLPVQAKLLHLLQSKHYYPLGASTPVNADVRVIAATNVDLEAAVAERRFREDLFYRLQVLPLRVPSLAERRSDVVELATFFCAQACDNHALPRVTMSREALRAAEVAEWPGNVRQLAHAIEAAAIRAAGEGVVRIERAHLFPPTGAATEDASESLTFQEATRRFHARLLGVALEESGWNVMEVARRLDLARSHVYTLIRAFGLSRQ